MSNQNPQPIIVVEEGKKLMAGRTLLTIILSGKETDGQYALIEEITEPGGGIPFLHTHPPSETVYILAGDYEFYGQDERGQRYTISASAGATVHIPSRTPHTYRNIGEAPGKRLAVYAPGGHQELMFEEIGLPVEDNTPIQASEVPMDLEETMTTMLKYGYEILEPPSS